MVLDQLGFHQTQQFKNINKTEKPSDNWVYTAQMDKLFDNHNLILTRILQHGLKIPQELSEKIKSQAKELKKIYFGLDNNIVDPELLPKDQGKFAVLYTETIPIVIPNVFVEENITQDQILTNKLVINLLEEQNWWDIKTEDIINSDFLKASLVLFSTRNFVKNEKIKMIHITENPIIPKHSIIFSLKCNFFTLLLFFYHNQQYFSSLSKGINSYLQFINQHENNK